ncbi:MAG: cupin domain-containing protein [Alphaproteobacteria bacterium]
MTETGLHQLVLDLCRSGWSDMPFEPFRDGIEIHRLYGDGREGPAAAILRYAPGGAAPLHEHTGYEHILVLEGSQEDEFGRYEEGALVVNAPGTRHSVRSPEGCVALLIWEKPVRFIDLDGGD